MANILRGTPCFKGARGYSAYEIAVQNGFAGDEKTWLKSIGYEELLNELPVNVKNFGAVGDGVTDDTAAIQEAINSVGSKDFSLCFPNGTYKLNSSVEILKSCKLVGDGAVIIGNGFKALTNKSLDIYIENITFKDILSNAIDVTGCNLTIENCKFINIGTSENLNPTYQGSAVYISNNFKLTIKKSDFKLCKGHGAIFTNGEGYIDITENDFNDNIYRAISLFGSSSSVVVSGIIANNYIKDCGKSNNTGYAVGCNGIYSITGSQVIVSHNSIINSRENAMEGNFKIIDSNIIDGTNVEITTKSTPSVEGIYLWNTDVIVTNNHLKNVKKRGIAAVDDSKESTFKALIQNNIIDNIEEYEGQAYSLYFLSNLGVSNKTIINNVLSNEISIQKSLNNNTYVGDLKYASNVNNIISPNMRYSFFHKFESIDPFTYGNCSPEIITSSAINKKVVRVNYQQYNKLKSPVLPNSTKSRIDMKIYCRGNFDILLHKGDTFFASLETINTDAFKEFNIKNIFNKAIEDDIYLWFVPKSGSYLEIASIGYDVIYE